VVISPREVMVNAKEPGKTTVIVWDGATPVRYDVDVVADTTDFDNFKANFAAQMPGSHIEITGKGETMVLKGTAADEKQIKLAGALAETRAKTVVNLITAPPGPEPRQIVLHVKFASIDLTALKQLGLNLFSRSSVLTGETTTGQFQSPRFSQLQPAGDQSVNFADLLNLFVYRPDLNIGATIQALQEQDVLQVLAEPNLMTVEGKTASFLAGGSFPFPVLTTTSTGGSVSPVITVQFKPFGVKLDFTPTVTPTGAIHLQVSPEVSSLDYSNAVTLQGFEIPALSQRKMDTEVELRDGESFAIAGLLDKQVMRTVEKIPGFGNIPIIGALFSSRSTKKTNTELLILITPHFVKPMTADQKEKMLDFPINFLPTAEENRAKKDGKSKDAEFVGPRGEQEPKP
ncbi:MAG TPA: pilus assembly protein N-terminal domain-containing protein, partial [Bryobacteraceae bacterium]|nr:pilus assembly protein N-terminal domain-containing protein [Bryobacteraceae bacterium]